MELQSPCFEELSRGWGEGGGGRRQEGERIRGLVHRLLITGFSEYHHGTNNEIIASLLLIEAKRVGCG